MTRSKASKVITTLVATSMLLLTACGAQQPAASQSGTSQNQASSSSTSSNQSSASSASSDASATGSFKLADRIAQKVKKGEKLVIRVSYHDTSLAFAQDIKNGVETAAKDLGVDAVLTGPAGGGADKQVAELETWLTKGVDGLAVSSAGTDALAPVINKALSMGIPVIAFNTDNPASKRMAFIGQDLKASGKAAGDELVKRMGTKGSVMVFTLDASQQWSLDRVNGFKDALSKYPDMKVVQVVSTGSDSSQVYAAVENAMLAHPDVTGIYATDCCTTPAVGKWIADHNKAGKYTVVGFDLIDQTLQQVKANDVTVAIGQAPYKQGYDAVKMLDEFITKGTAPKDEDTGVEIVDGKNIGNYLK